MWYTVDQVFSHVPLIIDGNETCVLHRVEEQLLYRNVQRFRGGLTFKAHRLLYCSTVGLRVKKEEEEDSTVLAASACSNQATLFTPLRLMT